MNEARNPYLHWRVFGLLAFLAVLPYARSFWIPALSDDHLQVLLGRDYGPVSGWPRLAHDALYRCRATSILITHWTDLLAGFSPVAFHATSVALHIVNTWLVFALGAWPAIGWRISVFAAGFFAVYEGHQEAVIWYAALPELLVFTFALAAFLCWVKWVESGCARARWLLASFAAFLLAIYSKESGVAVVPLLALPVLLRRELWRKALLAAIPFAAVAAAYFAGIFLARSGHLHFNDGTFVLSAPFPRTIAISAARLFWPWGLAGVVALAVTRYKARYRLFALASGWVFLTFLPYSFLTYMNRVPSRHTYFASVGLAWIVAAGYLAFRERARAPRWAPAAVAAVVILWNAGYVWTRKHAQFLERAAPIQAVVQAARAANGPVYVHCFPFPFIAAQMAVMVELNKPDNAVRLWTGKPETDKPPAGILCLDPKAPGWHPRR